MFDVGFTELLLIFVIGLLILGPERLPRVAAQIGRWVARARRTANQLRMQIEREVALEEIQRTKRQTPPKKPQEPPGEAPAGAEQAPQGGVDGASASPGTATADTASAPAGDASDAEAPTEHSGTAGVGSAEPGAPVSADPGIGRPTQDSAGERPAAGAAVEKESTTAR